MTYSNKKNYSYSFFTFEQIFMSNFEKRYPTEACKIDKSTIELWKGYVSIIKCTCISKKCTCISKNVHVSTINPKVKTYGSIYSM